MKKQNLSVGTMKLSKVVLVVLIATALGYFSYEVMFVFPHFQTFEAVLLNSLLISTEMFCAAFGIYIYYSIFNMRSWNSFEYKGLTEHPFVTIQVPIFNEPFNVIKQTLLSCMDQNYPKDRYEIIVVDDSTDVVSMKKTSRFCERNNIKIVHRDNRKGFKAGALNNALNYSRGEIIAVIDADDMPMPTFLSHSVEAMLSDPKIAFVQSRNQERNEKFNAVTKISGVNRNTFFGVLMKSRDAQGTSSFCGSGGIVKRSVLKKLGGWPEETVTEDLDFTTKVYANNYIARYINPAECTGLHPQTFTGLFNQSHRWAHGTLNILKIRTGTIAKVPGFFRRMDLTMSCMFYLIGPVMLAMAFLLSGSLILGIPVFHAYEPIPFLFFGASMILSSFFILLYMQVVEKRKDAKQIIVYMLTTYSMVISFTRAAFSVFFGRKKEFTRTDKYSKKVSARFAVARKFWAEISVGTFFVVVGAFFMMVCVAFKNYPMMSPTFMVLFAGASMLTAPVLAAKYG
jgi:cellulose synthase/poly-beta-1,6-N-acetylglucosamine synthase-like glycosyltransferase